MSKAPMCSVAKKVPLLVFLLGAFLGATAATAQAPDVAAGTAHATAPKPAAAGGLQPLTASNGLSFDGVVSANWGSGGVRIQADHIVNSRGSGTSGTLRVVLWATTTVPVFGNTITAYTLGSFTLNPLSSGYEYNNIDYTVAYTPPASPACYYITVALQEFSSGTYYYQDLAFLYGGTPDGSGHDRFSFGGADCHVGGGGPCVEDSTTACLLNGRFRATVRYRGGFDNFPADTNALRKPVTGFASPSFETSFFYFNSVNNIEILLKMLDQGNTDSQGHPTIAVLFGSATPLRVELTITDTTNQATRTYVSPFNSGQGGADFTAFVK